MSFHLSFGVISIRAYSVASGSFVWTSPMRLEMRCTWVSTHTDGMPIAYERTQAAVFRPTIGRDTSCSVELGTTPPKSSRRTLQHLTMASAFCFGNPAGRMSSATTPGSASAIASMESYLRNRLSDALRVLSSLVRWDRIVAIRTWNGSAGHSGFSPSELRPGYAPPRYSCERMSSIGTISPPAISEPPPPCGKIRSRARCGRRGPPSRHP